MGRGALVFKNDKQQAVKKHSKSKKKKRKEHSSVDSDNAQTETAVFDGKVASASTVATTRQLSNTPRPESSQPKLEKGKGKIISSNNIITGIGSQFTKEISVGDAILNFVQEMRIVTMIVSDSSCAISSAFSKDIKDPTSFSFMKAPSQVRNSQNNEREEKEKKQKQEEIHRNAYGMYGNTRDRTLVYREKTEQGSYKIQRVKLDRDVTRADLLNMRMKKKSDKYC